MQSVEQDLMFAVNKVRALNTALSSLAFSFRVYKNPDGDPEKALAQLEWAVENVLKQYK